MNNNRLHIGLYNNHGFSKYVSEREESERAVTLRCYGSRAQHEMSLERFEEMIAEAIKERKLSILD